MAMNDHGKLNDLAATEIEGLRREGVVLSDADVVRLNALGWDVQTPALRRSLSRGVPVEVGGVFLWPLTLHAADWIDRVGKHLEASFMDRIRHPVTAPNLCAFTLAYAMAHCYAGGDELEAEGRRAVKAVLSWAATLRCRAVAVVETMEQVAEQDIKPSLPPGADGKEMTIGDFSALLASTNGATPELWERRCSHAYASALMATVAAQNAAEGDALAEDPTIRAERALGWAAEQIRQAWREAKEKAEADKAAAMATEQTTEQDNADG